MFHDKSWKNTAGKSAKENSALVSVKKTYRRGFTFLLHKVPNLKISLKQKSALIWMTCFWGDFCLVTWAKLPLIVALCRPLSFSMSRMMSCELSLALSGSLWLDLAHFCTLWLIPSYSGHLWVTLTRSLAHSRSLWLTLPHSFSFWLSMALSLSGLFGSLGFSVSLRPYRSLTLDPSGSFNNSLSPLGSFWLTPALYLALSST